MSEENMDRDQRPDRLTDRASLERAANAGETEAMFSLGVLLREGKDPALTLAARAWLEKAATAGHVRAMTKFGDLLRNEWRYPSESEAADARAREWWEKAAAAGDTEAIRHLASLMRRKSEPAKARVWYEKAADLGDTEAMVELGEWLTWPEGQDWSDVGAARAWLEKAAEAGRIDAMCLLGGLAERMDPPDLTAAQAWYEKAVDTDDHDPKVLRERGYFPHRDSRLAMYRLGHLFEIQSDPPNLLSAQAWYEKAAQAGVSGAMSWLGALAEKRDPPDLDTARKWYEEAAIKGDYEEMYEFAEFLVYRCDPPELATAREWYTNVRDATGDPVAALKLGELCGTLMDPPDLPAARDWYELAILTTDWDELRKAEEYQLAVLLETRWDPPDLPAAKSLYDSAALLGEPNALRRLASLVGRPASEPDFSAARIEWEAMANAGDADAAYLLGVLNQSGLLHPTATVSRPADVNAATIWYRQAAEGGNVRAMVHLGQLLSSKLEARAWLEKAAASGDADAMYELGSLLQWEWEPPDESAAQEWFVKAAAAGHIRAQNEIE